MKANALVIRNRCIMTRLTQSVKLHSLSRYLSNISQACHTSVSETHSIRATRRQRGRYHSALNIPTSFKESQQFVDDIVACDELLMRLIVKPLAAECSIFRT